MDTAELQAIITMIQGLASEGKEAFIWWLMVQYGSKLFSITATVVVIIYVVHKGVEVLNKYRLSQSPAVSRLEALHTAARDVWLHNESSMPPGAAYNLYKQLTELVEKKSKH